MPTFGFSAFLKLLSLSVRRQRSEMRTRLTPSENGYDFHRAFRRLAHRYLGDGEGLEELLREAAAFTNAAEARSGVAALEYLEDWRVENPGELLSFTPRIYESPSRRFKVKYTPDFGVRIGGERVAIHIWNTKTTDLDARMTYAALTLFSDLYDDDEGGAPDLAVLSVPDDRLYRLSDVSDQTVLAGNVAAAIDVLVEEISDEIRPPPPPPRSELPRR